MANALQLNPAQPNIILGQNLDAHNLQYRQVADLRQYYLDKQSQTIGPWRAMMTGITLIIGVALGIFSSMATFPAVLLGIGAVTIFMGITDLLLRRCVKLYINRDAADAVVTPGFFEFARANPRNLGSAEAIVNAHQQFLQRGV